MAMRTSSAGIDPARSRSEMARAARRCRRTSASWSVAPRDASADCSSRVTTSQTTSRKRALSGPAKACASCSRAVCAEGSRWTAVHGGSPWAVLATGSPPGGLLEGGGGDDMQERILHLDCMGQGQAPGLGSVPMRHSMTSGAPGGGMLSGATTAETGDSRSARTTDAAGEATLTATRHHLDPVPWVRGRVHDVELHEAWTEAPLPPAATFLGVVRRCAPPRESRRSPWCNVETARLVLQARA
jgi:hypothetical protein